MGWYFRKSFGKGPFRINFSKSGISYSFGVKGARVNFGKRGTYVNFGSNGIYYRKKISGFKEGAPRNDYDNIPPTVPTPYEEHTITSKDVEEITDSDSQNFIDELTEKARKISYYNVFGILPLIVCLGALVYFFFFYTTEEKVTNKVTETKTFITALPKSKINIRNNPGKRGLVIGSMGTENYDLVDESNQEWYKINFKGQDGYVSKKLTKKEDVTTTHDESTSQQSPIFFEEEKKSFFTVLCCLFIFFFFLLRHLSRVDRKRMLVEIHYDIDDKIKEVYQEFVYHFSEITNCSRVWQYLHSEGTYDYKYTSGASELVKRTPLSRISTNKKPLKHFETNIEIPYLGLINTELFFFPERLIIKRNNEFGGIMYKHIEAFGETTRFIETESVPSDSVILDYTWRFLNKNGGPDRRFNNNYQIPICQYSAYSFKSVSGLNEKISTSKVNCFNEFIRYIKAIGQLQKNMPINENSEVNKNMIE